MLGVEAERAHCMEAISPWHSRLEFDSLPLGRLQHVFPSLFSLPIFCIITNPRADILYFLVLSLVQHTWIKDDSLPVLCRTLTCWGEIWTIWIGCVLAETYLKLAGHWTSSTGAEQPQVLMNWLPEFLSMFVYKKSNKNNFFSWCYPYHVARTTNGCVLLLLFWVGHWKDLKALA